LGGAKEKGRRTIERAKEITTKNKESKITYRTPKRERERMY
jgi:hypothetical protein